MRNFPFLKQKKNSKKQGSAKQLSMPAAVAGSAKEEEDMVCVPANIF